MARRKSLTEGKALGGAGGGGGAPEVTDDGGQRAYLLDVASIRCGDRMRTVDSARVAGLVASINEIGLQNPIIVAAVEGSPSEYVLCGGAHRLEAAKRLGWEKVRALVTSGDVDNRELVEIDENLVRRDLDVVDRAVLLNRRREIHRRQNPRLRAGQRAVGDDDMGEAFHNVAAKLTGKSRAGVTRDLKIGGGLIQALVDAVRTSPLKNREGDLFEMAGADKDVQEGMAAAIVRLGGDVRSLDELRRSMLLMADEGGDGGAAEDDGRIEAAGVVEDVPPRGGKQLAQVLRVWADMDRDERNALAEWLGGGGLASDLKDLAEWVAGD